MAHLDVQYAQRNSLQKKMLILIIVKIIRPKSSIFMNENEFGLAGTGLNHYDLAEFHHVALSYSGRSNRNM